MSDPSVEWSKNIEERVNRLEREVATLRAAVFASGESREKSVGLPSLRAIRKHRQISAQKLAEAAGVSNATVYGVEAQGRRIRMHKAIALAQVLKVSVDQLRSLAPYRASS